MQAAVAALLPERRGHFVYESGHHGEIWLDLEQLFLRPEQIRPCAEALAERLASHGVDVVCGPLVEGAFVAMQVASALGIPFTYSTPTLRETADGMFPVHYPIPTALEAEVRDRRVAVVNDVVNAGSAVRGTLESLSRCGAAPVVIATIAVYGDSAARLAAEHGVVLETLATFPSRIFEPDACPQCALGTPIDPIDSLDPLASG